MKESDIEERAGISVRAVAAERMRPTRRAGQTSEPQCRRLFCFGREPRQIGSHIRRKRRMVGQPREMRHRARKLGDLSVAQNGLEPTLFQCVVAGSLIGKETELGDEADIGQCHIVADEEHPIRPQGLLDAGGVGRERAHHAERLFD